jgi:hypothetical protein
MGQIVLKIVGVRIDMQAVLQRQRLQRQYQHQEETNVFAHDDEPGSSGIIAMLPMEDRCLFAEKADRGHGSRVWGGR